MLTEQELLSIKNRFGIIGNEPNLNFALSVATQVANTDLTVLIQGESGVGKEIFSQIIHSQSARKHNAFIAINCGAIPEGTIDSELFGHEKGSFTSAVDNRKGYFETVNGGTLFLDEIGEMPLGTQARLLRVLEAGEYIRVGSSKVQKTDVRVIAATNKDLLQLVQINKFREDLYYRLSTVPIRVAPLRDRKNDIPLLFRKFCNDFAAKYKSTPVQLNDEAKQLLISYKWPGNIRELKNIAEQVSVLSTSKIVTLQELEYFIPQSNISDNMPAIINSTNNNTADFSNEREIIYKLFFDMKKDVNDLKKMFYELLKNPQLSNTHYPAEHAAPEITLPYKTSDGHAIINNTQPYIVHNNQNENIQDADEVYNIAEKEKEIIIKALQKYKGRRRNAAAELGISERTLYRKITEYHIED